MRMSLKLKSTTQQFHSGRGVELATGGDRVSLGGMKRNQMVALVAQPVTILKTTVYFKMACDLYPNF